MSRNKILCIVVVFIIMLLIWGAIRYFLPLMMPFVMGFAVAAVSEPGVQFMHNRMHIPRRGACALGVTLELFFFFGILWVLFALGYRQITSLVGGIPELADQVAQQILMLHQWLLEKVHSLPESVRNPMTQTVNDLFDSGSVLLKEGASGAVSLAGGVLGGLPGGALGLGTSVISGYMISAQLPILKERIGAWGLWNRSIKPLFLKLKGTVGCWLWAQLKLAGITFSIVFAGMLILRTGHPLLWAAVIAFVDAIPMFGTGTVLIPWGIICLIQGQNVRALGYAGIYITAMITRSAMEPKLVGKELGLNPLITLVALYMGFRLWGVFGMVIGPVVAVTAREVTAYLLTDLKGGSFLI